MKLPSFKRIYETDFQNEYRDLVRQLSTSLNTGMENVYLALSNRITLKDNVQCTVKTINVTVNGNGIPQDTLGFQLDKQGGTQYVSKVVGCQIIKAVNLSNSAVFPTSTPFLSFTQNEDFLQIDHIAGLPAGNTFELTIVAYN